MKTIEATHEYQIAARSRGIGNDVTNGCIACDLPKQTDGDDYLVNNISFFVDSKKDGECLVALFGGRGARLDYRDFEPHRIQAKVGACDRHKPVLQALEQAVHANDDYITGSIVRTVLSLTAQIELPAPREIVQREIENVRDFLLEKIDEEKKHLKERCDLIGMHNLTAHYEARVKDVDAFLKETKYASKLTITIGKEEKGT